MMERPEPKERSVELELGDIRRELATMRQLLVQVVQYIREAESEIPESYRRFVNAFHDVHDIRYMYHEEGQSCPEYIDREIERLHDRYRQILKKMNEEGGTFNKVRRDMAADPDNRYDHTRLLTKGASNEAGPSDQQSNGLDKG